MFTLSFEKLPENVTLLQRQQMAWDNIKLISKTNNVNLAFGAITGWFVTHPEHKTTDLESKLFNENINISLVANNEKFNKEKFVGFIPYETVKKCDYDLKIVCANKDQRMIELKKYHETYDANVAALNDAGFLLDRGEEKKAEDEIDTTDVYKIKETPTYEEQTDFQKLKYVSAKCIVREIVKSDFKRIFDSYLLRMKSENGGEDPPMAVVGKTPDDSEVVALATKEGKIPCPVGIAYGKDAETGEPICAFVNINDKDSWKAFKDLPPEEVLRQQKPEDIKDDDE
jgi:hypothetical protein